MSEFFCVPVILIPYITREVEITPGYGYLWISMSAFSCVTTELNMTVASRMFTLTKGYCKRQRTKKGIKDKRVEIYIWLLPRFQKCVSISMGL